MIEDPILVLDYHHLSRLSYGQDDQAESFQGIADSCNYIRVDRRLGERDRHVVAPIFGLPQQRGKDGLGDPVAS